jgi:hypothetical protein
MSEDAGVQQLRDAAQRLERIAEQLGSPETADSAAVELAREAAQIAAEAGATAADAARAAAERGDEAG